MILRRTPLPNGARTGLLATTSGRVVGGLIAATFVAVLVGMVLLWPPPTPVKSGPSTPAASVQAVVVAVVPGECEDYAGSGCRLVEFELRSGPRAGEHSYLTFSNDPFAPQLRRGDAILVARNVPGDLDPAQAERLPLDDPSAQPFAFVDFQRVSTLAYLALAFVVFVIALGRWQGARSLIGLAVSLAIVLFFIVPAILAGRPPLLVAVVGGMAVILATTSLTHGLGLKSAAAILGTATALLLIVALGEGAVQVARITGLASEQSRVVLAGAGSSLSLQGLVIAGIVIGALGVLDDVTISQASTVLALKRADPAFGFRELFREGLQVGRDHLGATINTLVLAYVGAALPVLLLFSTEGTSMAAAVNQESVAEEIVATLVGSTGLVAAVPFTTALAALLATRLPRGALGAEDGHSHAH